MFKKFLALVCVLGVAGCIAGTVSDTIDVDNSISFSFPANVVVPAGVVLPTITQQETVPVDISDALSKIGKVATVHLSIAQNTITYNGSYAPIQNVTINLVDSQGNQNHLMNYDFSTSDPVTISLPLMMTGQQVYNVLEQGPANMQVFLTINPNVGGIPSSGSITIEQHLGLQASGDVSK